MPRRISRYPSHPGWGTLNLIESVGAAIIALGILVFLINVAVSLRTRVPAGEDPWQGHTLEWATGSPPPEYNFTGPYRRSRPTRRCSICATGRRIARA